ncbi:hypothetical protein GGS26DRAFT_104978 [Hypomontagnella submonticulosa]|nr:hypothetical protein GGS26DRAFT_104978 [Hypomontagnella submonticulosa]
MKDMRAAFTIAAFAVAAVQAQDLNQTIVGCVEVECPAAADNVNDNCTVADTGSFPTIGLTRMPTDDNAKALSGLSWVKGFNFTDSDGQIRHFHNSFYLGAPADLRLDSATGSCAVFLHGASAGISFGSNVLDELAQGTCADAMGSSCVDALVSRARSLVEGYTKDGSNKPSISDVCSRLQKDLQDSNDDACARISKGSWSNFTSAALTGDGAPKAIAQQQNSSGNCWPIIPKQDSLTLVSEYTTNGSQLADDQAKAQLAITPIITVFYPESNGSLVANVDASMTCVKVMGPPRASLDTISNGTNDPDSGAVKLSSSYTWASTALALTIAAFITSYAA